MPVRRVLIGMMVALMVGQAGARAEDFVIGGLATATLWGAVTGLLWGGIVRMFVVEQSMSAINSVLHTFARARLRPATTIAAISA